MKTNINAAARKGILGNTEAISEYTSGKYYRTYLDDPVCLDFTDDNFCCMVGYSHEEIHDLFDDRYIEMVYPEDRSVYEDFIKAMQSEECSLMTQYRLVGKNGDIIHVSDTMTSRISDKGDMQAFSVVTDLNDVQVEDDIKHIYDDIISCGIIRFTDEKYPSVISMNEGMEALLCADYNSASTLEDMKSNIYMMLPFEYREPFRRYLEQASEEDKSINLKLDLFRCDGERISVIGWICRTMQGRQYEYQGVFFDVSEYLENERSTLRADFIDAVKHVYDSVFEVNLVNDTIRCLHTDDQEFFETIPGVRMVTDDAIEYWSSRIYPAEDAWEFRRFFEDLMNKSCGGQLPQTIEFGICSKDIISKGGGTCIRYYSGTYFHLNDMTGMFCCFDITGRKGRDSGLHKRSNIMGFWKRGDQIKFASVSEETRRFIGISRKQLEIAENEYQNIGDIFANCPMSGEDIVHIINDGSMEYSIGNDRGRKIKRTARLIAASADDDDDRPYYAILYNIIPARKDENDGSMAVSIKVRTFGYFDVFVNGVPVHFKSAKAKELLAVIVDRRGGYVSASDAISCLWEDENTNKKTLSRYRKVAMRLKNELTENNISDIVISNEGKRCINQDIIECDLYEYIKDKENCRDKFRGTYMLNYSWGEFTQSELQEI